MHRLPGALVCQLALDHLSDAEAHALALSCSSLLRSLRLFRVKGVVSLRTALRCAITERQFRALYPHWPRAPFNVCSECAALQLWLRQLSVSHIGDPLDRVSATPLTPSAAAWRPDLRVGIVTRVRISPEDSCTAATTPHTERQNGCQRLTARVALLPAHVREVRIDRSLHMTVAALQLPAGLRVLHNSGSGSLCLVALPPLLRDLTLWVHAKYTPLESVRLPPALQRLLLQGVPSRGPSLPPSLTELELKLWESVPMENLPDLPLGLLTLRLGDRFDQPIRGDRLPASLTALLFPPEGMFNQPLAGVRLPDSLTELRFGAEFNQPLEGVRLPASLRLLQLGDSFNQSLEEVDFPAGLTALHLDSADQHNQPLGQFNQPVERVRLPAGLTSLRFGANFDQPVRGLALPPGLRSLRMGLAFDQPIEHWPLPPALTALRLDRNFCQPLLHWSPPASLVEFEFPESLVQSHHPVRLPPRLASATFDVSERCPDGFAAGLQSFDSLTQLSLWGLDARQLAAVRWPPGLRRLSISIQGAAGDVREAQLQLPPGLEELSLQGEGELWSRIVQRLQLPARLRSLRFAGDLKQPLAGLRLPPGLTELGLGDACRQPLLDWDPPASLTRLTLNEALDLAGDQQCLPPSTTELTLGVFFRPAAVGALRLPPATIHLDMGRIYLYPDDPVPLRLPADCRLQRLTLTFSALSRAAPYFPPLPDSMRHIRVLFPREAECDDFALFREALRRALPGCMVTCEQISTGFF